MVRLALSFAVLLFAVHANAQWLLQSSVTTADLRGIDSKGDRVAWASGTNGTVLRTSDGGDTWQACAIPPDAAHLDFRGVQAFDANTAVVMSYGKGSLSRLYKTSDGCHSWKLVFTNPDADGSWSALKFAFGEENRPYRTGTLYGDPVKEEFTEFVTHDFGETWTPSGASVSTSGRNTVRGKQFVVA